jgi:hypothetical protein
MIEVPQPSSDKQASPSPALSFIASNIASFSAIGLIAVVMCSTLFLYAYLSIFDWRLIWIIDYSDILKVGLVALAVLSTVIVFLLGVLQGFFRSTRPKEKARTKQGQTKQVWLLVVLGVPVVIGLAAIAFVEWQKPAPYQLYEAWVLSALFLLTSTFIIGRILKHPSLLTAERIVGLSSLLFAATFIAGSTFGTITKYSGGLRYDVFLKDREMVDVRLVLFTSHHIVLYSGDQVIVLPTSDITKVVAHPVIQQQP